MRQPLLLIALSLAVFLSADTLAQDLVQIQFQTDPVLAQTGTEAVFTVLTVPQVLSITWQYQGGVTLGLWAGGIAVVNPVAQFQGRITITATQLRIGGSQLRDGGNYTVNVIPTATTGLNPNSRSIQLRVFDAVAGVSLSVPSVAVEGNNVTLSCTWTAGTETTVLWGKGGANITPDSRITISGGSLVINPARRGDAGEYTCTVSNLISAQTAKQSLTVYYGPDTPVLTKDTPKDCVGVGDVLVGQVIRLTCTSDSLPPAIFSWQRGGQTLASGQADSGLLNLQTLSTNQSGRYVCVARNSITGGTSEQGTDLAVVDTCLSGGEVAGIVIGAVLLILIIVLLIVLIVVLVRRRRVHDRQRETVFVQKSNPNPRPIQPYPQPNGVRELGRGPNPPLYHVSGHTRPDGRLSATQRERAVPLNGPHNFNTHQHNGHTHTNGVLHNAIQNTNSYPHNGVDNPAFTHTDAQNANTPNSNILIQAGASQGANQQPAVQVSLNTLPQSPQHNSGTQVPTIHVNLNSFPATGQQTQQDNSFPPNNAAYNHNAAQTQQQPMYTGQPSPGIQSGQSYPTDPQLNGRTDGSRQVPASRELIPTGYTHFNSNHVSQQNANTQTYAEDTALHSRSNRNSERQDATPSSVRRQMPWDLLRGTPSYPREQPAPDVTSDSTDYTTHPPIQEARASNPSELRPQSQSYLWSRILARRDALSDRQPRSRSADLRSPDTRGAAQFDTVPHTQRNGRTQRESDQREIRGLPASQSAPGQEATHSNNPQALAHRSQPASVGRPAMSQGLTTQQGADTRALADPNHLLQAHVSQQHRTAPVQNPPPGPGMQTQPVTHGASHPRQGTAPPPSSLTQTALEAHTQRAQTFQSRQQQTQAALLSPGPRTRAPAAGPQHPPTPPPVIPFTQFQTIPKERNQHKSPTRGPQPPRPPVNIPLSQRNLHVQRKPEVQRHPTAMPSNHHHHPGNGHMHVSAPRQPHAHPHAHHHAHHPHAHARGHGHPAHITNPRQAHRGGR